MREPEERAQMLKALGFKHFAYDGQDTDVRKFDQEIEALKRHGVNLLAWWFPLDADDPKAKAILETFRHHDVHPQLWVALPPANFPKTLQDWAALLPSGMPIVKNAPELEKLSKSDKENFLKEMYGAIARLNKQTLTKTPQEQSQRIRQEANRIHSLIKLAAPYKCKVALYNDNGWFGMMENQVAIIERLQKLGVNDVGIVYNFSHARDELHDDTVNFLSIWQQIKPYVVAVNITGIYWEGSFIYPSQGDCELEMMRTIVESGWKGSIGLIAEKGGDAEVTLRNYLIGLDWLTAELVEPGSGGPPPFPPIRR